jgi:uncharacterized protein (DUF342 family)
VRDQSEIDRLLRVAIAPDRLQACIELLRPATRRAEIPSVDDVLVALQGARVQITDAIRERAKEFVSLCEQAAGGGEGAPPWPEHFVIAEVRPPTPAQSEHFEWAPEFEPRQKAADEAAQIDYFAATATRSVTAGAIIGRLVPAQEGVPGCDVFGTALPPPKPREASIRIGAGLRVDREHGGQVVAETDGCLVEDHGTLRVVELLEIRGDVDFKSGSIETVTDVIVRGTVRANFHVHTTRSLTVDRLIEAADVRVGGNVAVRGGIFGRDGAGRVEAGGSVAAAFINEMRVEAGGDVLFRKEVLNSVVRTQGRLVGERGAIIGGDVYAREGVQVKRLGSDAGVTTVVAVGTALSVLRRAKQMECEVQELRKAAGRVRETIAPLMANLKRLTPAQREQVTELLSKADEMDLRVEEMLDARRRMLEEAAPKGTPRIIVSDEIHPGVRLMIGARLVNVNRLIRGPVKIEVSKVDQVTEIVAINQLTGSITVLPSVEVDLTAAPRGEAKGKSRHGSALPESGKHGT